MIAPSARSPDAATASDPAAVDSSSVTVLTTRSPASGTSSARSTSVAISIAATPPFMSQAPRPYSRPSRSAGVKGSLVQPSRGSTVTTSMWPLRSRVRPPPVPEAVASSCGRPRKSCPGGIG